MLLGSWWWCGEVWGLVRTPSVVGVGGCVLGIEW